MKIFLDDKRQPIDCLNYMHKRIDKKIGSLVNVYKQQWNVVKNYPEFVKAIDSFKGQITHISFDHDLADGHYHKNIQNGVINYNSQDFESDYNKTGYHAAKYFKEVYENEKLEYPILFVHSMNPIGLNNIINLLK